jgi:hypothetical protein
LTNIKVESHLGTARKKAVETMSDPRQRTRGCSILPVSNPQDGASRAQDHLYPMYCFTPPAYDAV